MFVTTYIVKVCDKDPLGNGQKNTITYKFAAGPELHGEESREKDRHADF